VTQRFTGQRLAAVGQQIRDACADLLPSDFEWTERVTAFLLWRYTNGTTTEIAQSIKRPPDLVARAIGDLRALRRDSMAWVALLWRVEWSLHFKLGSAPWRD
jgi:hypothetical protein